MIKKLIYLLVLLPIFASAQSMPVTKAAIFKNGKGFMTKSARVQTENGKYIMRENIPTPMFGTLWLYAPGDMVKGTSVYMATKEDRQILNSSAEIFRENIGKRVKIIMNSPIEDENKVEYTGKIAMANGSLLSLQTADAWVTINQSEIVRYHFLDKPAYDRSSQEKEQVLEVDFKNNAAVQDLEMVYLSNQVGWLPSYKLSLLANDKATLTLRGMIFNNEDDWVDADVSFIVGVPNFKYGDRVSPMVTAEDYASFMRSLASISIGMPSGIALNTFSNVAVSVTSGYNQGNALNPGTVPTDISPNGEEGEDLYFYNTSGVNLKKGSKGIFDIFRAEVDCAHIYEATIPANIASYGYYGQYNLDEKEFTVRQVWHSVKLKNSTQFPWTTGSVLVGKTTDGPFSPLSQDDLKYTPPGAETTIKMTISPDILVKDTEREIKRIENKKSRKGVKYDLVTVEGKIEIQNFKSKSVKVDIDRFLNGMPEKSNAAWKTEARFRELGRDLNEKHQLSWRIPLKSGDKKVISYEYEVYIQR